MRWELVAALSGCLVIGAIGVIAVAADTSVSGPGIHATDRQGQPVGPFNSAQETSLSTSRHAPKPAGGPISHPSLSCPLSLGEPGPFRPEPGEFRYSDGLITGGYRALGSDGRFYELFGGAGQPDIASTASNLNSLGFILVIEYPSDKVDPCRALTVRGSDSPIFTAYFNLPKPTGAVTLIGATGDVVSYRTELGAGGNFNFVTRTYL